MIQKSCGLSYLSDLYCHRIKVFKLLSDFNTAYAARLRVAEGQGLMHLTSIFIRWMPAPQNAVIKLQGIRDLLIMLLQPVVIRTEGGCGHKRKHLQDTHND